MSDSILTQAEIDELLHALSSGSDAAAPPEPERSKQNVKAYDFRTANRFPKDQMRTMNIVFQSFCRLFSNRLTGILRTSCECELLSVEELTFNEFNNSLPAPVILAILRMPPMAGPQMIEISPEVAYMIINRLFGGMMTGGETNKLFTEIEMALIERVLRATIPIFDEAWSKVCTVQSRFDRIEMSPQFAQIVPLNEPVAIVTINVRVGEESGLVSVCIPHTAVEPVAKQLNTKFWYTGTQDVDKQSTHPEVIRERLARTKVPLTAYFEETPATVMDIANLQVGDVIRLNQTTKMPVLVKVQHIPKFYAKVGTMGAQYAVQIVDVIREDDKDESITG